MSMEKQEQRCANVFLSSSLSHAISGSCSHKHLHKGEGTTLKLARVSIRNFAHSKMGFSLLLRCQPYTECQLVWSKDNSKASSSVNLWPLFKNPFRRKRFLMVLANTHPPMERQNTHKRLMSCRHCSPVLCSQRWLVLQNSQLAAPTWEQSSPGAWACCCLWSAWKDPSPYGSTGYLVVPNLRKIAWCGLLMISLLCSSPNGLRNTQCDKAVIDGRS